MSHIFDTLRRVEFERNGTNGRVSSDAVDFLGLGDRKTATESESAETGINDDGHHPQSPREQRLRVMGSPLAGGGLRPASYPTPLNIPQDFYAPLAPLPAHPGALEPLVKDHQESAASIPQEKIPNSLVEEAPRRVQQEVAAPVQQERIPVGPVEVTPLRAREEVTATAQQERSLAVPAEAAPQNIPAGVMRTVVLLRTALPYVQRLLPLLDENIGTTISNLLNPQPEALPVAEPKPPVDLSPIENTLAELKTQHQDLHEQVIEQDASLVRIGDHLEMLRNSTDRNTLEQQELIEDLRGVGNKISYVVMAGLGLLAFSVAANVFIYLRIIKFHF